MVFGAFGSVVLLFAGNRVGYGSLMAESVRAVIFDFDGLLMDTESTNIASWEREWSRWGLTLNRATFFVPHGGDVTEHRYEILADAVGALYDRPFSHGRRTRDRDENERGASLSRLGLSCAEAVAVEDTAHGVNAAHAAGLACIAIPNPFVDVSAVAHAELTLRSATECTLAQTLHRVSNCREATN